MNKIKQAALPLMPWFGGKRKLAQRIVSIINQVEHQCYAEPFVGMGGVFLRRTHKPKAEIINDYSRDVSNLFRVLQKHPTELSNHLKLKIASHDEFYRLKATPPESLTDIERAARFIYLQKLAFGGKAVGQNFGMNTTGNARFSAKRVVPMITKLHNRISDVQIQCLDWQDFINRVDRNQTLFYLDPPYFGHENDYGKQLFDRSQFNKMAKVLSQIKGKFILSINDTPEMQNCFVQFNIKPVSLTYTAGGAPVAAKELIITNFDYNE
ncbi:MAG: DNA adenine methylase [Cumulibacter sp.]